MINDTIIQLDAAIGRTCWSSHGPEGDVISMEDGAIHRYSEVRCEATGGGGILRVVRMPDSSVAFEYPEQGMIVGYVRDGVRHGDPRLWEEVTTW